MSRPQIEYGLFTAEAWFDNPFHCTDRKCGKQIPLENEQRSPYFVDVINGGKILCDACGKCLRYARKKAQQRGEPIENASMD